MISVRTTALASTASTLPAKSTAPSSAAIVSSFIKLPRNRGTASAMASRFRARIFVCGSGTRMGCRNRAETANQSASAPTRDASKNAVSRLRRLSRRNRTTCSSGSHGWNVTKRKPTAAATRE